MTTTGDTAPPAAAEKTDGAPGSAAAVDEALSGARTVLSGLGSHIDAVTEHEVRSQDGTFDEDSRAGRELLFLLADDEWVRATTETVTLRSSTLAGTVLRFDVDLSAVAHEAFQAGGDRLALPLLVLTPPAHGRGMAGPLTVRDGEQRELPVYPQAEVFRRLAAGLAEILLDLAVPRAEPGSAPTREQRLVLSAALFRFLHDDLLSPGSGPPHHLSAGYDLARRAVRRLLDHFIGTGPPRRPAPGLTQAQMRKIASVERRLTVRAVMILEALRAATCVVTAVDRFAGPVVLTVELPDRGIVRSTGVRMLPFPALPRVVVEVPILLPSADSDRRLRLALPAGTETGSDVEGGGARAEIEASPPHVVGRLGRVMGLLSERSAAGRVDDVLAQLGLGAGDGVTQALRRYQPLERDGRSAEDDELRLRLVVRALGLHDGGQDRSLAEVRGTWTPELLPTGVRRVLGSVSDATAEAVVTVPAIEDPDQRGTGHSGHLTVPVVLTDTPMWASAEVNAFMGLLLMGVVLAFLLKFASDGSSAAFDTQVLTGVLTLFSAVQAARVERHDSTSLPGWLGGTGDFVVVASLLPPVTLALTLSFTWVAEHARWACVVALVVQLSLVWALRRLRNGTVGTLSRRLSGARLLVADVHDAARADVLVAPWWREAVADSLLLGREAHAYVTPHDGRLGDLLDAPRRSLTGTAVTVATMAAAGAWDQFQQVVQSWQRTGQDDAELREAARRPRPRAKQGPAERANGARNGRRQAQEPSANILGLLRAGTPARSLTFVVFREEPTPKWQRDSRASGVFVDVGRLVSREASMAMVSLTVGVPDTAARHAGQVLAAVLDVVAAQGLTVDDVQLPVPPPLRTGSPVRSVWFRVRLLVQDDDLPGLRDCLETIGSGIGPPADGVRCLATTSVGGRPTWLGGEPPAAVTDAVVRVRPADMDVLRLRAHDERPTPGAAADERWYLGALCGYARPGLEAEVLGRLAAKRPTLVVHGFTAVPLHGMAVLLVLARETAEHVDTSSDPLGDVSAALPDDRLSVHCAEWTTRERLVLGDPRLGRPARPPGDDLLLRVHVRCRETPGALASSLEALARGLSEAWPDGASEPPEDRLKDLADGVDVWYAQTRVLEGRVDEAVLTVRVPRPGSPEAFSRTLVEVEHRVREALAHLRDPRYNRSGVSRFLRDDTLVRVRPVVAGRSVDLPWTLLWTEPDAAPTAG